MKSVEPIRDKKIDAMKAIFGFRKNMGNEIWCFFSIGINTAYRISDLRRVEIK